jgi:hypothetical protein
MPADRMLVNTVVIIEISAPYSGTDPVCEVPNLWKGKSW